jgi:predicted acetyltransferase
MTWTPRLIEPDELPTVVDLMALGFGAGPTAPDDVRAAVMAVIEAERTFVVEDDGRLVGVAGAFTFEVALPRGGAVPMAGVTNVAVSPTHRRRGLLNTLIETVHDQAVERGEPLSGLTASEGGIYRRFGYGVATRFQQVRIDTARSAEIEPRRGAEAPPAAGGTRFVTEDAATTILPAVWDRHWRRCPGEVNRTPGFWVEDALDTEDARAGASTRFIAVHEDPDGHADGFVTYRIAQDFAVGGSSHEARVQLVASASEDVEAALLRFVLDLDLVGTVTWLAPVDLPLRWRLADPRALTVSAERDHLWLRPLDVAACLAGRGYAAEGELRVQVMDERRRDVGGTFLLSAEPGRAECERDGGDADVIVAVADLGSVLAGGTTWRTLERAGHVVERAPGAVDRADALFRPERAASCATDF